MNNAPYFIKLTRTTGHTATFSPEAIQFVEARKEGCYVFCGGRQITVKESLEEVEAKLQEYVGALERSRVQAANNTDIRNWQDNIQLYGETHD